jgi:hypothetical protein
VAIAKIVCPECKKSFKGRDDLAGKRIRCPSCGSSFVVPAPTEEDAAAAVLMAADAGPSSPKPPVDEDEEENPNPYGVTTIHVAPRCPNCANEMVSEDAVICLFCGYNVQTRALGQIKKIVETTGGDWAKWVGPGIGTAAGILFIVLLQLVYVIALPYWTRGVDMWLWNILCSEAMYLWITMLLVGAIWPMGLFVFKRLIVEPTPPEKEFD